MSFTITPPAIFLKATLSESELESDSEEEEIGSDVGYLRGILSLLSIPLKNCAIPDFTKLFFSPFDCIYFI